MNNWGPATTSSSDDQVDERNSEALADLDPLAVIESSPDGIVVTDESGTILLVNSCIESMFGYDRSDLIGRSVEVLVPPRLRQRHGAHRTRYRAEPVARPMGSDLELMACDRSGTEIPVEISLSPIKSEFGLRFIASVRDVSERLAAEASSHAVLHMIDAAHDGVFMFQPNSLRFTYVNQGAVNQLGYSRSELLEMSPLHIKPEFTRSSFNQLLEPLLAAEVESIEFTTTHRRKDGQDIPVDIVLDYPPAPRADGVRQIVALVRDISGRRQIESERDKGVRWLEALAALRSTLIEDPPLEEVMAMICEQACALTGSEVGAIAEFEDGGDGDERKELRFRYFDATGDGAEALAEPLEVAGGFDQLVAGNPLILDRVLNGDQVGEANNHVWSRLDQLMIFAIEGVDAPIGALVVGRRGSAPYSGDDASIGASLATEAHNAYSLTDARRTKIQVRILEDRERLGRDLHDLIIQRIFAAGLRLQSAKSLISNPVASERLDETIAQLDETISELRNAIFRLSSRPTASLARRINSIIEGAAANLGYRPRLEIEGNPDSLPIAVAEQVEPVLTEALANVHRHADASKVDVLITVTDETLSVTVADDGIGFDLKNPRGNGLDNLEARAVRMGGSTSIASTTGLGTTLTWTAAFAGPH